ncbi:low temperature requirement protein A [Methanolobus sp. ZRKC2]|uniref:low temperature requirement protein A n=1 Tax=Methanolobus sp. ZRKC2 TaxID=3125783 RepID=UPI0032522DE5
MIKEGLSRLWQSPRSAQEIEDRNVTFLELFYDLIYVVIIAELAHLLAQDISLAAFESFVFLFVLVWWTWLNAAYYHNLHGYDDLRTRVFVFLQMAILVAMTVFINNALEESSYRFAFSYAAFLALLAFLWWRTGVHDPKHRLLSIPYIITYSIAVILFIVSVFIPTPLRFIIWGIALLQMLLVPGIWISRGQRSEYILSIDPASATLRERFKLFTIIVLGEAVVAVISGLSRHHDLNTTTGLLGTLGLALAFGLWWIYFEPSAKRPIKSGIGYFWMWNIIHLPIWIGITAIGVGVLSIISIEGEVVPSEVRWLLSGSIAMVFISAGILLQTLSISDEFERVYNIASFLLIAMGIVTTAIGFFGETLSPVILLFSLLILMLIPILYGLYLRLYMSDMTGISVGR